MRPPERLKPQTGGYAGLLMGLSVPVSLAGLILLLSETAARLGAGWAQPSPCWAGGDPLKTPGSDVWRLSLWAVHLGTAAWIYWALHLQKNTYTPIRFEGPWWRRLLMGIPWLLLKGVFFILTMMLALALVVPLLITLAGLAQLIRSREPDFTQRVLSDTALLLGLSTAVVGLTAFSRAFGLWSALRHVVLLPTSPGAALPQGLVEIRGTARPLSDAHPANQPLLIGDYGRTAEPFWVDSDGVRIRVEPPKDFKVTGGQALLPRGRDFGHRVLQPGDPVLVLGRLSRDPQPPGTAVLRPDPAPRGSLLFTGRRRFFSLPDLFLIAHGDETTARRRLAAVHVRWILLAAFFSGGGVIIALVGLAARIDPALVNRLASAGGFR